MKSEPVIKIRRPGILSPVPLELPEARLHLAADPDIRPIKIMVSILEVEDSVPDILTVTVGKYTITCRFYMGFISVGGYKDIKAMTSFKLLDPYYGKALDDPKWSTIKIIKKLVLD